MTEFLVTGGAGFIGSNIVRNLVQADKSVRVLDNLATGRMDNINDLLDRIQFIEGDITDGETAEKAVDGVRCVLHLAALPSVPRSVEDPLGSNRSNILGTLRMLTAARDAGVERFVYSSSSSVYGDTPVLPKREDMIPMPLSPYAVQKLTGEYYCGVFHSLYGLKTFSLRYFNVFGPSQNPASQYAAVVPLFINALKNDRAPVIYGDGEQTRDFTFVEDVVAANLCCCDASDAAAGRTYNVARGDRISVNRLAATLNDIMGKDIQPMHDGPRPGDVRDSQADSSLAHSVLGWQPSVRFEDGLRRTVEYFSGQNPEP
jgi:nucleoside-diphosphate-sugar epimerase